MEKALAVFDLDHTLVKANMSVAFGKYLYKEGIMPFHAVLKSLAAYGCHKGFSASFSWLHTQIFNAFFKQTFKRDISSHVERFLDFHFKDYLYLPTFQACAEAKESGSLLALLSSSPDFIVEPIARRLNIPYWIGTCYSVDAEGRFSGISCVVDGNYKAQFLNRLIKRYALKKELITAYSDSLLDLPMMRLAGTPIGVCPGRKFYRYCKNHGWKII